MKKILIIILIFPIIFLCGFKKREKPFLIMSSAPVNEQTLNTPERTFSSKKRIYYSLIAPEGFKYSGIRMQLSKQSDKTSNWGFSIVNTEDIYIVKGDFDYRSYFVVQTPGRYIIQFFYSNNKRYPFIHREFMVI